MFKRYSEFHRNLVGYETNCIINVGTGSRGWGVGYCAGVLAQFFTQRRSIENYLIVYIAYVWTYRKLILRRHVCVEQSHASRVPQLVLCERRTISHPPLVGFTIARVRGCAVANSFHSSMIWGVHVTPLFIWIKCQAVDSDILANNINVTILDI